MVFKEFGFGYFATNCKSTARIDGKCVILTGGNTGIGKETAIELAKRGARVAICCRSIQRAEKAVEEIKQQSGSESVLFYELDLASLQSVRECAAKILSTETSIDILINNAAVMMTEYSKTVEGYEMTFGVNHLGHFLFTLLLLDKIKQSEYARIINLSSAAYRVATMDFENLNSEIKFGGFKAYTRSKLANILFSRELANRTKQSNIRVYCVHPGAVDTEMTKNVDSYIFTFISYLLRFIPKTAKQGAQTTIHCAVDKEAGNQSGLYYYECEPHEPIGNALNDEIAKKLWDVSLTMVSIKKFS